MIRLSSGLLAAACGMAFVASASAQTLDPAFSNVYTLQDLGTIVDVPSNFGGMVIKRDDANTLLIGGNANNGSGRIYAVPLIRDGQGHITGFGAGVDFCAGANNDGGLDYAPNGTLFVAQYPQGSIGQVLPGNSATFDAITPLGTLGVAGSLGGLAFVPPRQPGAGRLKLASYSVSRFYNLPYTVNKDGTYTLHPATVDVQIQGGCEGFVYVPECSQSFPNSAILMCEYGSGAVTSYDVDANGDPIPSSRRIFISGLSGAEGAIIDPVTGDFLFGTYGGGSRIIRVVGFPIPSSCPCNWNNLGCVNSQDFFDFLTDFFGNNADFNEDTVTNSQDFFDFLACFFGGCD
ncbi:MAG: hypothetical protein H7210_14000 [Pyrinomonadaceae bacterium]|nr:hypothetical protein [Phycisphaerales bacterium]